MEINGRIGFLFLGWLAVLALSSLIIGPERKRRWFYLREASGGLFSRRGLLGELTQFGFPKTREGWMVFGGFLAMILSTGYLAVGA